MQGTGTFGGGYAQVKTNNYMDQMNDLNNQSLTHGYMMGSGSNNNSGNENNEPISNTK